MILKSEIPLATRMRPQNLEEIVGQEKIVQKIKKMLDNKRLFSIIFWGSPGVGKTTLAFLIAKYASIPFRSLSAIQSGVKEVREAIAESENLGQILLFIDEIHRFNKSQQDSLLKAVEEGKIILIGATTENPSFEVNKALLSRSEVMILNDLSAEDLKKIAQRALDTDEWLLSKQAKINEWEALLVVSGGDGRKLLSALELCVAQLDSPAIITNLAVNELLNKNIAAYDKSGEMHYDIISAFIKSIRGSDPNAAVYYLARMISGGEDPKFIARRMLILASEDIGLANTNALLIANTCFDAVSKVGYPECRIILSQTAIYLATSPKSNSTYLAIDEALAHCQNNPNLPVPLHLRNAPTKLMKEIGYGQNYQYAHNYKGNFVRQQYLPDSIKDIIFYRPGNNPREREIETYLKKLWEE